MNPLLQRAKDEVAQKQGFDRWDYFYRNTGYPDIVKAMHEVCEFYAKYRVEEEAEKMKAKIDYLKEVVAKL